MARLIPVVALVLAAFAAHGSDGYLTRFEQLLAAYEASGETDVSTLGVLSMMHPRWLPPSQPKPAIDAQRLASLEKSALDATVRYLERDPKNSSAWTAYMRLVEDLGAWKDALALLASNNVRNEHYARAAMHAHDADAMSAAIDFLAAAARDRQEFYAAGRLALAALKKHTWPESVTSNLLRRGIESFRQVPDHPGAQLGLHELLVMQGDPALQKEANELRASALDTLERRSILEKTRGRWSVELVQNSKVVTSLLQRKPFTLRVRSPYPAAVSVTIAASDGVTLEQIPALTGERDVASLGSTPIEKTTQKRLRFTFVLLHEHSDAKLDSRDVRTVNVDLE